VNDAVDRIIVEREAMDAGFARGLTASAVAHLFVVVLALVGHWIFPSGPPIKVADGFAVVLPRGGGGAPAAAPPAPAKAEPEAATPPAPVPVEKPPDVIKPPKEPPPKNRLPEPNAPKARNKKPEKVPPPTGARQRGVDERAQTAGGTRGGSGASPETPGLSIGPPGPGVPDGTDTGGDWYLASVQQKIWMIWTQQIKTGFTHPIGVAFTILADGTVTDVRVTQPSGATLLDLAAQRSIYSAAPFAPLPKEYGTNRKTIEALFRPVS
jgi:TonB family protein